MRSGIVEIAQCLLSFRFTALRLFNERADHSLLRALHVNFTIDMACWNIL